MSKFKFQIKVKCQSSNGNDRKVKSNKD